MGHEANYEIMRDSNGFFYCSQGKCFQYKKENLIKGFLGKIPTFDHGP